MRRKQYLFLQGNKHRTGQPWQWLHCCVTSSPGLYSVKMNVLEYRLYKDQINICFYRKTNIERGTLSSGFNAV